MKKYLPLLSVLSAFFVLIIASREVIAGAADALILCAQLIIPSLFPFFVASSMLCRLGLPQMLSKLLDGVGQKLFRVSGKGFSAFIVGLFGGYPMGASYIADMEKSGAVSTAEAEKLLAFCSNSGPAFIIGAIGSGIFASPSAGLLLYLIHILSAVMTGIVFRGKNGGRSTGDTGISEPPPSGSFSEIFTDCVKSAVTSVLSVCGFVIVFAVMTGLLTSSGLLGLIASVISRVTGLSVSYASALLSGLFELGSGIGRMRGMPLDLKSFALAAGIMGFGSVSVCFQTSAVLSGTKIKGALYLPGRLVCSVFSVVLSLILGGLIF